MTMAPMSSIIASDTRKIFRAMGTRLPSSVNTPRAKAISVAAGIAQPCIAAELCQLKPLYIAAGTAMPPTAAIVGRINLLALDS